MGPRLVGGVPVQVLPAAAPPVGLPTLGVVPPTIVHWQVVQVLRGLLLLHLRLLLRLVLSPARCALCGWGMVD